MKFGQVAGFLVLLLIVGCASAVPDYAKSEHGTSVEILDGHAIYRAAGTTVGISVLIDGSAFEPKEKEIGDKKVKFNSGEKSYIVFADPEISESYSYENGNLEESVTIKRKRAISYQFGLPEGVTLVRQDDGSY